MPPAERAPALRHAFALGLVQGPAELLPVSSSAHATLIPWLAGWPRAELDGASRKSFEVALHAGTAAALALVLRGELLAAPRRSPAAMALAVLPPALAGYALRGPIERWLGRPGPIAAGLAGGAVAMALADARPAEGSRPLERFGACDGLALGLAQTAALMPGVSRSGATLAAARARGFGRAQASALSWLAGLPVLIGAGGLEAARLVRSDLDRDALPPLAAGALAAFASTLLCSRAGLRPRLAPDPGRRRPGPLLPYALYRAALAVAVVRRLRRAQ